MGNSSGRPSCLGGKRPAPGGFPKESRSAARNSQEERAGSPEKASRGPRVTENGWSGALGGAEKSSPLPKQNNLDVKPQNRSPLQARPGGAPAPCACPQSPGTGWGPRSTRELTEVTEVTETVVTEIVEVTRFPGGDGSPVASVARTATALPGGRPSAGPGPEAARKLRAWVEEAEGLVGHQKPPSGEARVVRAQLQEQKLLLHLLKERTSRVDRLCRLLSAEPAGADQDQPGGLASLQEKWATLVQEAEARHGSLRQILPAALVFQEATDTLHDWLSWTERNLAQLWGAEGSLARSREARQQVQDLCRDVQSKPAELEEALERGRRLLQVVSGEEGQLVRGKVDSLRMRVLLLEQRSGDVLQRLEQASGAASRLAPAPGDWALGLQPLEEEEEEEQPRPGSPAGEGPVPPDPADRETSPPCMLHWAQEQQLQAQYAKVHTELGQWPEEAWQAVMALSPGGSMTILSCEALREQQEALESLREAIAEQKPLVVKLRCPASWLAELRPREVAPLWPGLQAGEEQYASPRERAQQSLPGHHQLSGRLELVAGSLKSPAWEPPTPQGDPVRLQEQSWESGRGLAGLEKLSVAPEALRGPGAELQPTLQTTTHPALQEHLGPLLSRWRLERGREDALQEVWAQLVAMQRCSWAQWLEVQAAPLAADPGEAERLSDWIAAAEEALSLRDQEPLPGDARRLVELRCQHTALVQPLDQKQPEVGDLTRSGRRERAAGPGAAAPFRQSWPSGQAGAGTAFPCAVPGPWGDLEPPSPTQAQLAHRWQRLRLAAQERQQHRLRSSRQELEETASFDLAAWRQRYLQWVGQNKSQLPGVFGGMNQGQEGRLTHREFAERVLASEFPTSLPEMKAVAEAFDTNGDGFIDYDEFISALYPRRDLPPRAASVGHIQEEVNRRVAECSCAKRFQVEQIGATRYRFGECQQLRMVRILRSTLMVRVGGGWAALDEFLVKNDPCRVKGRTNLKINERFLSPGLLRRRGAGSQSAPASKTLSPSGSTAGLTLYSSASAPSSPLLRKAVLRRARSGDRSLHSRPPAGATRAGAEPPGRPGGEAAPRGVPAP